MARTRRRKVRMGDRSQPAVRRFALLSRRFRDWHWHELPSLDERSPKLLVLPGVCRLLKLELCRHRPMPRVTRDSSIALQIMTQSFLNCLVRIAYRNGLQHEFSGRMNTVNTLASSSDTNWTPNAAVSEKKAIGAQQRKSVNTSSAIRLAIRESFEFHA